jgi:hypothetical protein
MCARVALQPRHQQRIDVDRLPMSGQPGGVGQRLAAVGAMD